MKIKHINQPVKYYDMITPHNSNEIIFQKTCIFTLTFKGGMFITIHEIHWFDKHGHNGSSCSYCLSSPRTFIPGVAEVLAPS